MNKRQKIIVSITGITLVLLILVGLTYAYFLTRIQGNTNTKSISVTTANLSLVYADGNGIISGTLIEPGEVLDSKTFTVTNEGNAETEYIVVIDNVVIKDLSTNPATSTTFESNDFVYTLTCVQKDVTSGLESGTCESVSTETSLPLVNNGLLIGNKIPENKRHEYELIVTYKETNENQSNDMNKSLEAKVDIKDIRTLNPYSSGTLAYNIINNSVTKKNGTELRSVPLTNVAEEISTSTEKELSITSDDLGTSYYFRGAVEDNYVDFAGMCWRIVRIEGNGAIKLILEDQDSTCASSNGNWNIPTTSGGNTTTGNFGYDDSTYNGKSIASYLNPVTTADRSQIYAFYNFQNSLSSANKNKLKVGNWCYDDKAYTTSTGGSVITNKDSYYTNGTAFYYDSYVRLYGKSTKEPTLKCQGTILNRFNNVTYNNNVIITADDMYVGTLTADEIVYAGGKVGEGNSNYYLINDYQKGNGLYCWSLSPNYFYYNYDIDHAMGVGNDGYVFSNVVSYVRSFRPAVSLKSGATISGGDGTQGHPYVIN